MKLVRNFNNGDGKIFLLSLKSGGTGLNLTGADTVIHYDPWWNPAVEDQATDRAYRIGQTKTVHVMKLVTHGTIEEKILVLKDRKKQLVDAVIHSGETLITKMSQQDLKELFEM
jgi:SNF2 family DNA or RNA helicase